jgi:hypothetical protein
VNDARFLLRRTADHAADFLEGLDDRPVFPPVTVEQVRARLAGPLPNEPTDPATVIDELVAGAGPGVVANSSGRYFGFVVGGSVPAALAADWLTSAWDQNAGLYVLGPSASVVEEVAGAWLRELLRVPSHASFAFVTGCQMANVTALAAARWHVLHQAGWDVNVDGLAGVTRTCRLRRQGARDRHASVAAARARSARDRRRGRAGTHDGGRAA